MGVVQWLSVTNSRRVEIAGQGLADCPWRVDEETGRAASGHSL